MMNPQESMMETTLKANPWRGLGAWNYYFLLKFGLLVYGYLNFHALDNLLFLTFLLFPLRSLFLHRCRHIIAIPIGLALFYHDTWLPSFYSIMSQGSNLFEFSIAYAMELLNRFINWHLVGAAFILLIAYLYLSQWIRITTINVIILFWLNLAPLIHSFTPQMKLIQNQSIARNSQPNSTLDSSTNLSVSATSLSATNENLNQYLSDFYAKQSTLHTEFPAALSTDALPFDVLIIQICSLAWADIDAVQLQNHPLWARFDILFNHFNSAASYSGPAAIRLLRASCGQTPHQTLYTTAPDGCFIMDNLAKLGFPTQLMLDFSTQAILDHTGIFGDFLKEIREFGGLGNTPLMSQKGIDIDQVGFNGQPLYNDLQLLKRWLQDRNQSTNKRSATFFNIIALHDGNRSSSTNQPLPYKEVATKLFNQLNTFFNELEQSGRKTVVVFIPEHGRNLLGDQLQISGLRDIPSPTITHVPVAIKFFGMKAPMQTGTQKIETPSSYLAISELLSRLINGQLFNEPQPDINKLIQNLPQTDAVSENEGVTVINYQGKYYILLKGETHWVPYP